MKIAIFIPYIGGLGGHQRVIVKLATYLESKKHKVELFTQRHNKENSIPGFKNLKINILKPSQKIFAPFVFLFKKIKNFDVVVVGAFPATLSTIRNKPSFYICYTPKRDFYDLKKFALKNSSFFGKLKIFLKNLFFKKIDFIAAQKATVISPISKTIQKRTQKYYKRKTTGIIYPGIDFNSYKTGKYGDYLLCVSRFLPAKRVDLVIKAMDFVKNKKIKLYIVGEGPEEKKLKKLSKKYKDVRLIGEVSDKELIRLYSKCLAGIYMPFNEDWGLVPLEFGASGKPTIGANEGGLRETIVDKKTGFLISNPTPEKISNKINYFVQDKKRARKMGEEARKRAKNFDWKNLLPEWEKLILKVH
ncbi:MAG: glycosyltransferase family 4 protein [Nanoarchaeota archaeon]|nr:glycosyltransferase family 4 protein [Nanoarchaeota archaeon]MBU1028054.1 glycosyltransferase family 4 protein [Nanoarchaeota archaeon]